AELERKLADLPPGQFDYGLHNELRHLYGGVDPKKAMRHVEAILKQQRLIVPLALLISVNSMIYGCAPESEPPAVTLGEDDGFVDIDLAITDVQTSRDGTLRVVARGKLDGTLIGLIVDVLPDWKAQRLDGSNVFVYWGKVRYRSLGTESDAFIAALTRL